MTPRVVITGTAGFLGSHLLEQILRRTDFDVIAVDSLRHNGISANVRDVLGSVPQHAHRVQIITHDIRSPFNRADLRELAPVDYVIHAAAFSQVGHSVADPVGFIDNNVHGALTMLEIARRSPELSRFVLISTDEVYGPAESDESPHDARYRPSSPYAASKACQELIAQAYGKSFQVPVTVVNISNMFGPRQSQLAFTSQVIRKLREGSIIDVHIDENGEPGSRYYSFVRDVAEYITQHVHADSLGYAQLGPRLHVPGHQRVYNDTLVSLMLTAAEIDVPLEDVINRVKVHVEWVNHDTHYGGLNGDHDWQPFTPLLDAYRETWDWYQRHPEWLES